MAKLCLENIYLGTKLKLDELFNYFLNKILVGTWFDGKPIYRQVFYIENKDLISNSSLYLGTVSNIDNVIRFSCNVKFSGGNWASVPFMGLNSNNYVMNAVQTQYLTIDSKGQISIYSQFGTSASQKQSLSKIVLVLEYTEV